MIFKRHVLAGLVTLSGQAISQTITPTPTQTVPAASLTAVSECHLHGSSLFCMAGTTEYLVHTTVTATQDVPPRFTGCHTHGSETFCLDSDGGDVEISLASDTVEGDDHDDHDDHDLHVDEEPTSSSTGKNCHFHAGVEHCVGEDESEASEGSCEKIDRDYSVRLRVGLLFVMLATSSIGVFSPILLAKFISTKHIAFTVLRQFGTGVVISTAFIHLFTHAVLMFQNKCLGELAYESTPAAILMAGIFLSFCVEYAGNRIVQWHESKVHSSHPEEGLHRHHSEPAVRTDMVNIAVLECGVIFHSLLIGLTLVVAGDTFFLTLFAVIVFHQMFEGIALGTRIAALGRPCPTSRGVDSHGHVQGHGHAHGHEHYHDHDLQHDSHPHSHTPGSDHHNHHAHSSSSEDKPKHNGSGDDSSPSKDSASENESGAETGTIVPHVSLTRKLLLATGFALVTPIGMAIGIGVLKNFNGNDPSTVIAIGTLDALSAGILVWVGVVEMWAHDWMLGGEMTRSGPVRTVLGFAALVAGMALMSLLGKWA